MVVPVKNIDDTKYAPKNYKRWRQKVALWAINSRIRFKQGCPINMPHQRFHLCSGWMVIGFIRCSSKYASTTQCTALKHFGQSQHCSKPSRRNSIQWPSLESLWQQAYPQQQQKYAILSKGGDVLLNTRLRILSRSWGKWFVYLLRQFRKNSSTYQ